MRITAQDAKLQLDKFLSIARKTQNFIKHAKADPCGNITMNEVDTEHLLFLVIQNLCLLLENNETLSNEASIFQLWFMAIYKYPFNENILYEKFSIVENMTKNEQIKFGHNMLQELQEHA